MIPIGPYIDFPNTSFKTPWLPITRAIDQMDGLNKGIKATNLKKPLKGMQVLDRA